MLLWELAFEKEPYEGKIEIDKVSDYVIGGGREEINFSFATPEVEKIQKGYEKIIKDGN